MSIHVCVTIVLAAHRRALDRVVILAGIKPTAPTPSSPAPAALNPTTTTTSYCNPSPLQHVLASISSHQYPRHLLFVINLSQPAITTVLDRSTPGRQAHDVALIAIAFVARRCSHLADGIDHAAAAAGTRALRGGRREVADGPSTMALAQEGHRDATRHGLDACGAWLWYTATVRLLVRERRLTQRGTATILIITIRWAHCRDVSVTTHDGRVQVLAACVRRGSDRSAVEQQSQRVRSEHPWYDAWGAAPMRSSSELIVDEWLSTTGGSYSIVVIPRSREVGQSYWTSVFTTLYACAASLRVVFATAPDVVRAAPIDSIRSIQR